MRRLYVQIYLTIIASLVLVVIVTGAIWQFAGRDRLERDGLHIAGVLAAGSLVDAKAPEAEQQASVRKLSKALKVDIALYDRSFRPIASWGNRLPDPSKNMMNGGRIHGNGAGAWQVQLPDKRWLIAGIRFDKTRTIVGPIIFLGAIALIIGLCAYPLVRRLTGRLERLQQGVERVGAGDFSARVVIEGKDEIAQLALSFNSAAERIEKLLVAHRQLLANASHELRTPLSRIRLGIDLLHGDDSSSRKSALEQDIKELDQLIDEILLMSRLDANQKEQAREVVDLLAIAAEECARFEDCTIEGKSLEIMGDRRLLQRMIRNLLVNASRHGRPPIVIRLSGGNDGAIIEVLDHGPGVPLSERDKVFAPFFRLPDRQNVKGSGLGLALVRQIAESHVGEVALFDDVQSGLFGVRVTLPVGEAIQSS